MSRSPTCQLIAATRQRTLVSASFPCASCRCVVRLEATSGVGHLIAVGRLYVQSTTRLFTISTSAESTHAAEAATEMVTPLNCKCTSYGYCCDFVDSAHSLHTRPVVVWERIASAANHPCTLRPLYWTRQRCLQCQLKWFTRRPVTKSLHCSRRGSARVSWVTLTLRLFEQGFISCPDAHSHFWFSMPEAFRSCLVVEDRW